ncbi:electron transfer flavoprotein subunit beta/FixA family protein [Agromyces larvae]|uniref:Electron transfer flavoprotein subunit beta n=1 Tax=Agromyces larvae TaxID=2929802 RepID=A0ABY4BV62_9MICO|nr:electron transfer flavoprotein subunit beta/FixA family protein [Agromyces larvae]UOE43069.1 electron transfer flavoprotein subunit beta/FixA family protein [Agromyces larvae]
MKIVVLVKEVPDTYGDRVLDLETGLARRDASDPVLDEIGERALEVALAYADAHEGTEVVALTMAPASAATTLRKVLAIGAGSAVQVVDDALLGADLGLTAEVLAAAIRRVGFDLVLAGDRSTDGVGGVLPAMVAELLDVPNVTGLDSVQIGDGEIRGVRATDGATVRVSAALPAVASITEALPDARIATFKGIMAAKKKPLDALALADLGVDADDPDAARSIMLRVAPRPPRQAGVKIVDDGDAGVQLADFLIQNRLA